LVGKELEVVDNNKDKEENHWAEEEDTPVAAAAGIQAAVEDSTLDMLDNPLVVPTLRSSLHYVVFLPA
jgi:hypothetical protein